MDELVQLKTADLAKWNYAPRSDWTEMSDTEHFVQFYEADGFLLNSLSGFIGTALNSGDAALVVATPEHRDGLDELLKANGVDTFGAIKAGRYVSTVRSLMTNTADADVVYESCKCRVLRCRRLPATRSPRLSFRQPSRQSPRRPARCHPLSVYPDAFARKCGDVDSVLFAPSR
jgi:hypothetical protein